MSATAATRYDVAEHLRTPEEMAAYLEVCLERPWQGKNCRRTYCAQLIM